MGWDDVVTVRDKWVFLRNPERAVLSALASHKNPGGYNCWPSVETIQDDTGLCRSTVLRAIVRLKDLGALDVFRLTRNSVPEYILNLGKYAECEAKSRSRCLTATSSTATSPTATSLTDTSDSVVSLGHQPRLLTDTSYSTKGKIKVKPPLPPKGVPTPSAPEVDLTGETQAPKNGRDHGPMTDLSFELHNGQRVFISQKQFDRWEKVYEPVCVRTLLIEKLVEWETSPPHKSAGSAFKALNIHLQLKSKWKNAPIRAPKQSTDDEMFEQAIRNGFVSSREEWDDISRKERQRVEDLRRAKETAH